MDNVAAESLPAPRRFEWRRVTPTLLHPRQTLAWVLNQERAVWVTPLLIISLAAVLQVLAVGFIRRELAAAGAVSLPEGFEYWGPEQQAQFMQAQSTTTSATFIYVLPAAAALLTVWLGWLYTGGGLHLALTIVGFRTTSGAILNLAAWAGLPYAVRSLIRAAYVYFGHRLIASPGLSGFTSGAEGIGVLGGVLLGLADIYVIWHVVLLVLGVRQLPGATTAKAWGAVVLTVVVGLLLQSIPGYLAARLSGMTIIRPFLF
ncbi:MAG TPA: YIP1 family protein [Anaerolineales bacterium]|nr:YIP1 family protein [Anaerolineales bacterium]